MKKHKCGLWMKLFLQSIHKSIQFIIRSWIISPASSVALLLKINFHKARTAWTNFKTTLAPWLHHCNCPSCQTGRSVWPPPHSLHLPPVQKAPVSASEAIQNNKASCMSRHMSWHTTLCDSAGQFPSSGSYSESWDLLKMCWPQAAGLMEQGEKVFWQQVSWYPQTS